MHQWQPMHLVCAPDLAESGCNRPKLNHSLNITSPNRTRSICLSCTGSTTFVTGCWSDFQSFSVFQRSTYPGGAFANSWWCHTGQKSLQSPAIRREQGTLVEPRSNSNPLHAEWIMWHFIWYMLKSSKRISWMPPGRWKRCSESQFYNNKSNVWPKPWTKQMKRIGRIVQLGPQLWHDVRDVKRESSPLHQFKMETPSGSSPETSLINNKGM